MNIIAILLMIIIVGAMILTIRYSIESRHGAEHRARNRRVHGKLNMSMGVMLACFAAMQLLTPLTTARGVFAGICLLLGAYNFWSGYRNWKND